MMVSPANGRDDMGMRLTMEWWLRSPGNNTNNAAVVNNDGTVNVNGNNVNNNNAVRPAIPQSPETCTQAHTVRA